MNKYTVHVVVDQHHKEVRLYGKNPYDASNRVIARYEADGYRVSEINILGVFEGWE